MSPTPSPLLPVVLAETERTRVTRVAGPTGPLIRKEALGRGAGRRLRHEAKILQRLAGVQGVVQLAAAPDVEHKADVEHETDIKESSGSILLEDINGTALSGWRTPLGPDLLLAVAEALARAVAGMHHRGVVHRDISPANVVATPDGDVCLIDFALATTLTSMRSEFTHHAAIIGTVPYLAPEQTGRTSRPIDHRADLYAVGATLYELAAGAPPFGADDPLRIIHDHLARVPVPASERNPAVPRALAQVIAHLLEKEPDDRYQSAEGLAHDLALIRRGTPPARPGARDRWDRQLTSSRLVGRNQQIDELRGAFLAVMAGQPRSVLVEGEAGVGKTALVDELRVIAAGHGGWFVAGAFDQHRLDQAHSGFLRAIRALGRLLLAEPEERLVGYRDRLRRGLGRNVGLAAAAVPELGVLLDVQAAPGDLMTRRARAAHTGVEILRAVASTERPVVCFVDNLQWANRTPLGILEPIFGGSAEVDGLLLVGAYRASEVGATTPLAGPLGHWLGQPHGPRQLRLENLTPAAQAALIADVLHVATGPAAELARMLAPATRGNPRDTLDLLTTLRREELLDLRPGGWQWDPEALRRRLHRIDFAELLTARVAALPGVTVDLLAMVACLGAHVDLDLLAAATALPTDEVERRLALAIEIGVLVPETVDGGRHSVRFQDDRTRQTALVGLTRQSQDATRLRLARNLAGHGEDPDDPHPQRRDAEYLSAAAEQYLPVLGAIHDPAERRRAAALLRRAAGEAKVLSNHAQVERYTAAAATLLDPSEVDALLAVHIERHAALRDLGLLDEADEVFQIIDRLCTDPLQRTAPTVIQIRSLTDRARATEAIGLGVEQLRRLGMTVPDHEQLDAEIDSGLDAAYRWIDTTSDTDDLRRAELVDEVRRSAVNVINGLSPAAFFSDHMMLAWLTVRTLAIWAQDGPSRALLGPASQIAITTITRRADYRAGHRILRRLLAVGHARGYEPEVWLAEFHYLITCGHWFEPLEHNLSATRRALDELVQSGDFQGACWAHHCLLFNLLDCAPSLDLIAAEAEAAMKLATRTGNQRAEESARVFRRLVAALRGETEDVHTDETAELALMAGNSVAVVHFHITNAILAAVFDRPADLARHLAAVEPLLAPFEASYMIVAARLLRVLMLAQQIRSGHRQPSTDRPLAGNPPAENAPAQDPPTGNPPAGDAPAGDPREELDEMIVWLSGRAADAPVNFLHVLYLAQAEQAWAIGDFQRASYMFDAAHREAISRSRPWHLALILEEAARFYLGHGLEVAGRLLLVGTRRVYAGWGATAKVNQLDWGSPGLRSGPPAEELLVGGPRKRAGGRSLVTTGTIDLRGIVAASRALSSETSVAGLRAAVVGILSEMTGATDVHLLLRDEEREAWTVTTDAGPAISLREAGQRHLLPPSVVWYAERTGEPVVVTDVATDDRFRRDPCFCPQDRCSLLAVPISTRGRLRAMLLLENRMISHAFSADRLEGIMLVAGQLAVSLDNALMYASLERKVEQRTQQLAAANRQLKQLSVTDPLTGLANRRRLDEILDHEWRQARRRGTPIALAMVDIDHFKLYNDHFGHGAGDHCLRLVARCVAGSLQDPLIAARYGGEEFAVVMPDTDAAGAARLARHICAAVEALAEPHPRVATRVVTVSIGTTALVPTSRDDLAGFVECADAALYRAKRGGRNRAEVVLTRPCLAAVSTSSAGPGSA
ncbi:diguanylate cyclase (GGDEF) domain-containing protein [Parafrankia irregularis]|uniref:Diguanylate cyclase (GGDEF) domain-containing protein n=1 Tax=Parafrankia irregularis TaxID=795642 RepID=A0A0S4QUW3_9ACTN|nr:diguanylate cyclase [Parafrankia irregularis]CUU58878.1 diguanylate cyclase (GGDEF) domain-containing protein [Parafrankia irregularis]